MEVDCDNCGETIERKPSEAEDGNNFCDRDCYHEWRRTDWDSPDSKVDIECRNCGEVFKVYPYREDSAAYCSRECSDAAMKGRTGKDTPAWKGAKEEFECQNCGDVFKRLPQMNDNKYCSDGCYREASKELFAGKDNPAWRGGYEWNYGPNWDEQRTKALERDDHECQRCGKEADDMRRSPDIHHRKRLGWFREEYDAPEWYQKGNALNNLITLCPQCHGKIEWTDAEV